MESIVEFRSSLDGRIYTCLYRRAYSERCGCYSFMMIPGSLRWEGRTPGEETYGDFAISMNESLRQRPSTLARGTA
jgi:hypothetical protein